MEESIPSIALAGFVAGAGLAFVALAVAPRMAGTLKLAVIVGMIFMPFLTGVFGGGALLNIVAEGGGKDDFMLGAWIGIFILSIPLGALCVVMFNKLGPRIVALTAGGLVGLPVYLSLAASVMAFSMVARAAETTGLVG
jgi:hypothetical protein